LDQACDPFCVKTTGQCYAVEGGFACRCTDSDQSTMAEADSQTLEQCEAHSMTSVAPHQRTPK
jgi:hypothetical protein